MKKITTFLALLLTCIIGATAADFVPKAGAKYLIKCKGDSKYAIWNTNCKKTFDGTEYNVLSNWNQFDTRSLFTVVSTGDGYFYIKPAADGTRYVFAINTIGADLNENAEGNVAVKEVTDGTPDDACKWTISAQGDGWNIIPKGGQCSWNNRGTDANGNAMIGQWYQNDNANSIWYFSEQIDLNGYYTMRTKDDGRGPYLYNDFNQDNVTRGGQLPTTVSNKYVWHVTSAIGNKLTLVNGEGTPLGTRNSGTFKTLDIAWTDGTYHFFSNKLDAGNANAGYQASTWENASKDLAQDLFRFDDASYTSIYTVNCNVADGYVTYNATSEKAKNGGFFNIATAPTVGDFTAKELTGCDVAVSIEGNTIKVNYTYNLAKIKQLANEALAKTGVGYPTATAAARTALQNAVNEGTDATAIVNALNAFKTSTEDIQLPEDGKAYYIKVPYINGTANYLYSDGNNETSNRVGNKADDQITDKNDKVFVCHIVNGKYMFATNHGTYLSWADSGDGDKSYKTSAQTTTYVAQNDWTIEPATLEKGAGIVSLTNRADVFGYVQMKGLGKDGTTTYYLNSRINDAFVAANPADKFYDANNGVNRSCYYQFEEVEYPNTITFHDATGINGVSHIATFSAPFATIIPEGVKAYYVSAKGAEATMTAIDAEAIPANQGVILTSESGAAATMVPAAGETAATITGNQLGHSAGAARALTAGEGYILGNGTEGTAFYPCKAGSLPINKAYLLGNGENAIVMNFGNAVTGINTIAAPASAKAPIFDLSGRRVVKATKGLYIQNGKKVIVK